MDTFSIPELIVLPRGVALVGRSQTANIRLPHPSVSRHHAQLQFDGRQASVCDLGGVSGTRVNGQWIHQCALKDGDQIEFGPIAFTYQSGRLRRLVVTPGVAVEIRDLRVVRNGQILLDEVRVSISQGAFVGILGPSGAGKSTLIKCLAGYLSPAEGTIQLDQINPTQSQQYQPTQIGYVPQENLVYLALSCQENLTYALALRSGGDLRRREQQELVLHALSTVGLDRRVQAPASQLSGGECKRLNVAMELLGNPRLLLLDEPTAGLDPATESRLMRHLQSLARQGTTVICSTHVLENLALFDQVIVLAGKTVQYSGPPKQLLHRFGVSSYPALYEKLDEITPAIPATAVATPRITTPPPEPNSRQGFWSHLLVQFLRGFNLIVRDPMLAILLVVQPVVIGFLINLSQVEPNGLKPTFLFSIVTAIWLGMNNTAREIVRERTIQAREFLLGVSPLSYLLAKVLLHALIGMVQMGLLAIVIRQLTFQTGYNANKWADWGLLYFWLVLWTTNLSAQLLGLLVSALVRTQEAAIAWLPLLLLPQILLTGVASGLESEDTGSFGALIVLIDRAPQAQMGVLRWTLEIGSLATYSRPAAVLLHRPPADMANRKELYLVNWLHQILLLLLTAGALVAAMQYSQRRWLERL